MITTGFLSMWISNTATAAMILPIAHAVLQEIGSNKKSQHHNDELTHSQTPNSEDYAVDTTPGELESTDSTSTTVEMLQNFNSEENVGSYNDTCEDVDSNSELTDASNRTTQDESYNTFEDNGKWRTKKRVRFQLPEQSYSDEKLQNDKSLKRLSKGLMLGVAYAANIGGTATLTGTGPNLVLKGDIAKYVGTFPPFISCFLMC